MMIFTKDGGYGIKLRTEHVEALIAYLRGDVEKVEEIIDFLDLQKYRRLIVGTLPYGIQKRIELGRALALEPELLLLDEPMGGLSFEEKEDMAVYILEINEYRFC